MNNNFLRKEQTYVEEVLKSSLKVVYMQFLLKWNRGYQNFSYLREKTTTIFIILPHKQNNFPDSELEDFFSSSSSIPDSGKSVDSDESRVRVRVHSPAGKGKNFESSQSPESGGNESKNNFCLQDFQHWPPRRLQLQ